MESMQSILRTIPKVDLLLERAAERPELRGLSRVHLLEAIRQTLEEMRREILDGGLRALPAEEDLFKTIAQRAEADQAFRLRPVINATGVVLHTNLGRAALGAKVAEQVAAVASSYCTLEYDLAEGSRGSRQARLEELLIRLTGCEAALVVNNNAAAVLLLMTALFQERELIVSRGELVEIGGSFRIPDIMEQGGVRLRAVGSTNRTSLADYARALDSEKTGGLLKVHSSNFRIIGYTEQQPVAALAELAHANHLPLIFDQGGGNMVDLKPLGIHDEPTVQEAVRDGADLICFSGDKLLGGAQAGLVIGRRDYIARLAAHPLARALRVDKMSLAALEATLQLYLDPEAAKRDIPTLAMLFADPQELEERARGLARMLAEALPGLELEVEPTESQAGGGTAPEKPLPSWAVSLKSDRMSEAALEEKLRRGEPPVIARLGRDRLLLDVRTIAPAQFAPLVEALKRAAMEGGETIQAAPGQSEPHSEH